MINAFALRIHTVHRYNINRASQVLGGIIIILSSETSELLAHCIITHTHAHNHTRVIL